MARRSGSLRRLAARTLKRLSNSGGAGASGGTGGTGGLAGRGRSNRRFGLEALEPRVLFAAPQFMGDIFNQLVPTSGVLGLTFGIDGFDADDDDLTITVTSDDPKLTTYVTNGNRFAKINFVKSDNSPLGSIVVELFDDRADSAAQRFVDLATKGYFPNGTVNPDASPFYNGIIVHRVVPGFVIQTGDPTGTGSGESPLPDFNPNTDSDATLSFAGPGALAWANSGSNPATSNSQWFITAAPTTSLDAVFNPFGQIISGWDVYDQIINLPRTTGTEKPTNPPKMQSIEIFQSTQDASVTLKAQNGWDGQANLTITLSDGTDTVTKVVKAVSSTILGSAPTLVGVDSPAIITPGQQVVFDYAIQDTPNLGAVVSGYSDVSTATVTINNANETITVATPNDYYGLIQVLTQAKEEGFDPRVVTQPGSQIFSIFSVNDDYPDPLAHIATGTTGAALSSVFAGNRLWVANSTGGIEVYDITNPNAPALLKRHTLLNTQGQKVQARDLEIIGNTAVVTTNTGGTYVVDISNLNNIQVKSRIVFDAQDAANSAALQIASVGNVAFVTEFTNGLAAYDVSNPASPVFLGKIKSGNGKTITQAMDVLVVGNHAYVTDQAGFVFTIDITNPAAMTIVDQVSAGVAPWGMAYRDNKLYVADQGAITTNNGVSTVTIAGRLLALDLTDPTNPSVIGQRTVEGAPWQVTLAKNHAVVSTQRLPLVGGSTGGNAPIGKAVSFVDITNAANMSIVREFDASSIGGRMDISGGKLAMPLGLAGVALMQLAADVTADNDTATVQEDESVTINVLANDSYENPEALTVIAVSTPGHGTAVINEDGTITYTPDPDFFGSDGFTYTVSDGAGGTDTANVQVTVAAVPEFDFGTQGTFIDGNGVAITVKAKNATAVADVDADGNIIVLRITSTGNGAAVTVTSKNGDAQIGDIVVTGTLAKFTGKTVDLAGDITATGAIENILLDDISGPSLIDFDAAANGKLIKFKADQVHDLSIASNLPFAAIQVNDWQDTDGTADTITAPYINVLQSKGDLEAGLNLSGTNAPNSIALGTVKALGALAGAWRVVGHSLSITAGSMSSSFRTSIVGQAVSINVKSGDIAGTLAIRAIGSIKVSGNLNAAKILAGVDYGDDAAAGGTGANADVYRSGFIQSITVKGQILDSTIQAGRNSASGTKAVGGTFSQIGALKAAGMDPESKVLAGALPSKVKLGIVTVLPATDERFTLLPPV